MFSQRLNASAHLNVPNNQNKASITKGGCQEKLLANHETANTLPENMKSADFETHGRSKQWVIMASDYQTWCD